ncbi:MAG: aminoglycoside phosphotransferase family protein [Anaerolineae bacterium]|nr:aminoglycoside phosphotransferase family protein [Anaerolineae bacterium]
MPPQLQDPKLPPNYERRLAMIENTPEFEPGQVARAVEELTGRQVNDTPIFVPHGLANENWAVGTTAGRLLVKIGFRDAPVAKWRAAGLALDLATRAGLPVPQLVASHEQFAALDGRVVRLFEQVEGYTLAAPDGPGQAPPLVWTELGAAVRRLHTIRLDAFSSRLDGSAPSFATWDTYLAYRIPQTRERVRASHWLDDRALAPLWAALQATTRRVAPTVFPTLTHRDLHVDNVLISPSGHLAAILDWDQAEAWDPVGDFFKLRWLLFEEVPGAESAFVEGYGSPAAIYPHLHERLHIVTALGLIGTIAGALPDEAVAVHRLRARLQSVAAAAGWPCAGPT